GGNARGLLVRLRETLLAHEVGGGVEIALGFHQGLLTFHHPRAGALAELLDCICSDIHVFSLCVLRTTRLVHWDTPECHSGAHYVLSVRRRDDDRGHRHHRGDGRTCWPGEPPAPPPWRRPPRWRLRSRRSRPAPLRLRPERAPGPDDAVPAASCAHWSA